MKWNEIKKKDNIKNKQTNKQTKTKTTFVSAYLGMKRYALCVFMFCFCLFFLFFFLFFVLFCFVFGLVFVFCFLLCLVWFWFFFHFKKSYVLLRRKVFFIAFLGLFSAAKFFNFNFLMIFRKRKKKLKTLKNSQEKMWIFKDMRAGSSVIGKQIAMAKLSYFLEYLLKKVKQIFDNT